MSALSDPDAARLDDPAETGDAFDDPKWRELTGLGTAEPGKRPANDS